MTRIVCLLTEFCLNSVKIEDLCWNIITFKPEKFWKELSVANLNGRATF